MSKLIVITAPTSSTPEERTAEEQRTKKLVPRASVICLLDGWKVDVLEVPGEPVRGMVG